MLVAISGKSAIDFGISSTLGGNVVNMGQAVQDRIDALVAERPIGMNVLPISEQGASVKVLIHDFVVNVVVVLAILVGTCWCSWGCDQEFYWAASCW